MPDLIRYPEGVLTKVEPQYRIPVFTGTLIRPSPE
jgi:hypothetical protein